MHCTPGHPSRGRCHCPHFADEETAASGEELDPKSCSQAVPVPSWSLQLCVLALDPSTCRPQHAFPTGHWMVRHFLMAPCPPPRRPKGPREGRPLSCTPACKHSSTALPEGNPHHPRSKRQGGRESGALCPEGAWGGISGPSPWPPPCGHKAGLTARWLKRLGDSRGLPRLPLGPGSCSMGSHLALRATRSSKPPSSALAVPPLSRLA